MPSSTAKRLVIVESPAKARKIADFLGPDYVVEASMGHIRDLPRNANDVPAGYEGVAWARLGVNVDDGFKPLYVVSPDRKKQITRLKQLAKEVDEVFLATDEDREGEAIAWHLLETIKPRVPVKRMVFHEITKPAIQAAIANPRDIDRFLVDAQEARRILDRLYGYEVSPVLWKKVMPKLSAGRVQSVATRIVVDRERQRMAFRTAEYWDILADLAILDKEVDGPRGFSATLIALDGDRIATGKDFEPTTGKARGGVVHLDEGAARGLAARLDGRPFVVTRVEEKPYRRRPYPPFITSTLQQEAARKLRSSSAQTMRTAQRLYENGYITYMRTDSVNLSETALDAARRQVRELYGDRFVPTEPRRYASKVKNAQEAHEAIRPSGDSFRTPGEVANELSTEEFKLYELIWRRTIASQMTDAVGSSVSIRIRAVSSSSEECDFGATGKTITDPGFLKAYVESSDDEDAEAEDAERRLPNVVKDQPLRADALHPVGHSTQPPARYTEASLVKALEELGIGRPSTYASIMGTIQDRGYVFKRGQALIPSFLAFAVVNLLEQHFEKLVDYQFTASMEDELDEIAGGTAASVDFLTAFYFGGDMPGSAAGRVAGKAAETGSVAASGGLKKMVTENLGEIDARGINSIPLFRDDDGRDVVVRVGRYGPYLQRTAPDADEGDRAALPEGIAPDELSPEKVDELFLGGGGERKLGEHPETGEPVVLKSGRFGPYVSTGEKNASLLKSHTPDALTLEQALRLLSLPRVVGKDPEGNEILAMSGRYGPYVKRGEDSRSLESEEQIFTVSLDEALALLAAPKGRQRRAAAAPLREMGNDPVTEKPLVIKDGRFGPYVTDGEYNASLRRGQTTEALTLEQASEMLSEKRAKGPVEPKKRAPREGRAGNSRRRHRAREEGNGEEGASQEGGGEEDLGGDVDRGEDHDRQGHISGEGHRYHGQEGGPGEEGGAPQGDQHRGVGPPGQPARPTGGWSVAEDPAGVLVGEDPIRVDGVAYRQELVEPGVRRPQVGSRTPVHLPPVRPATQVGTDLFEGAEVRLEGHPDVLVDGQVPAVAPVPVREPDVVGGADPHLHRQRHLERQRVHNGAQGPERLRQCGSRQAVLHLHEAHFPRRAEHLVRRGRVGTRGERPGLDAGDRRDGRGEATAEPAGTGEHRVGEEVVVQPATEPVQWLVRGGYPVVALGLHPVGVGEPVQLEVVVALDVLGQAGEDVGDRVRLFPGTQDERVHAAQGDLGEYADRADADPGRLEDVRVLLGIAGQDRAVAGDQGQRLDERREAAEFRASSVGTGGYRPGDCLRVDVAEVGQGESVTGQQRVERVQRHPGRYRDEARRPVHPYRRGQRAEIQAYPVGDRGAGERVPRPDRLDGEPVGVGGTDRVSHLGGAGRPEYPCGGTPLVSRPVRPVHGSLSAGCTG